MHIAATRQNVYLEFYYLRIVFFVGYCEENWKESSNPW